MTEAIPARSLPSRRPLLVASDLDGTLLAPDLIPRRSETEGLRALRTAGVRFVPATGRMVQSARSVLAKFGVMEGTVICYQGAYVGDLDGRQRLISRPIPGGLAADVVLHARVLRRHLNAFIDDELHVEALDAWAEMYMEKSSVDCVVDEDLAAVVAARPPDKLLLLTGAADAGTLAPALAARWQGRLYVTVSQPGYIEMTEPQATKRAALVELCRLWGVPRERTVACGDAFNDLDMLEWAGFAVAMAESPPEVRAAAQLVLPRAELGALFGQLARLPSD